MPALERERLAELFAALSVATDLGSGLPPETSIRCTLIGVALARAAGRSTPKIGEVFYAGLLRHLGGTASAHEEAGLAGDDLALKNTLAFMDRSTPLDSLGRVMRDVGKGQGALSRTRAVASMLARAWSVTPRAIEERCEVAERLAVRLGAPPGVRRAIAESYERFDGKGRPAGKKGEGLSPVARTLAVAELAALYLPAGDDERVRKVVRSRSKRRLDPSLATLFGKNVAAICAAARGDEVWQALLDAEPQPRRTVDASRLDATLAVLADVADLKSVWRLGHSRAVATLAVDAGGMLGLDEAALVSLRRAALLLGAGSVGVSNALWDKRGRLDGGERDRVLGPVHSLQKVLSRSPALRPSAALATLAHEQLDRVGGKSSATAADATAAQLLAAADVHQALVEDRPHRPARTLPDAARALEEEARSRRFGPDVVAAVIAAAARRAAVPRAPLPAGLSADDAKLLLLHARGLSDGAIAAALGGSARATATRRRDALGRIAVRTRAGVALFLVENDLVG